MKKVIEVSIGGINFTMEDDAYFKLKTYLNRFKETISDKQEAKEVMEDVEARVAEIFQKGMKFPNQVVESNLVQEVINRLGEIESEPTTQNNTNTQYNYRQEAEEFTKGEKRLYRDTDDRMIAGVCSGVAAYFGIDSTIVRVLLVIAIFLWGTGVFAYVVLWLVMPKAVTVAQKLQMRGYAVTADNIRKFSLQYK